MRRFDSFVVLGEMRTGSNLLETQLNEFAGVTCHGELFNPVFINKPGTAEYLGVTFAEREADPHTLLAAVRAGGGLTGFRLFSDHDPRVRDHVLADPACAKIVLTRNPLDSYVSRKIAAATDQWKLHNVAKQKSARVTFVLAEFERHLQALQDAQQDILHRLQISGQSAFYIGYDDLLDIQVLNGLAAWLGIEARINAPSRSLKKQNPGPLAEKLTNPEALEAGLARIDRFDLGRTPNFEPRRGPMLDVAHGGLHTPLLFLPLRGGPEGGVIRWLAALDGVAPADLPARFDPAGLSAWRQAHPGHRAFSVLRHPLVRAHRAFCQRVLSGEVKPVREHLLRLYGVDLPEKAAPLPPQAHRDAFAAYLRFCRASLSAQAGLQPWPFWASQSALLQGMCEAAVPDMVLREEDLATALPALARAAGAGTVPPWEDEPPVAVPLPVDDEILALCREAYWRDYEAFGFADLPGGAA